MSDVGRKIIVVEDDEASRRLLELRLQRAGYDVQSFANGQEALRPITELGVGMVLADRDMPEMSGLQLCQAVREMERLQVIKNVYFLLVTSHQEKDKVIEGLEAGANDYLTKPYHAGELLARIQAGERLLRLQEDLLQRTLELHRANAEMAVLAARLEHLANTDALTQLANRRSLFRHLHEAWAAAEACDRPFACVMIDIDRFKVINDTYGHACGDEVLQSVAALIRDNVRRPELCGRFGGEEFLVVLPATGLEEAARVAERLRTRVAAEPVHSSAGALPITISCGVAGRTAHVSSGDALLREADAMLYQAKAHGRNQTWLATGGAGERAESECAAPAR